jgi:hypothetical protein
MNLPVLGSPSWSWSWPQGAVRRGGAWWSAVLAAVSAVGTRWALTVRADPIG